MQDLVAFGSDVVEVGDRLRESDTAAGVLLDPGDDLVEGRSRGQSRQLGRQVALKGGSVGAGPLGELAVDVLRDVSNKYMRHAFIMQAPSGLSQPLLRAGDWAKDRTSRGK